MQALSLLDGSSITKPAVPTISIIQDLFCRPGLKCPHSLTIKAWELYVTNIKLIGHLHTDYRSQAF